MVYYQFVLNRTPSEKEKLKLISRVYYELSKRGLKPRKVWVKGNILYVDLGGGEFATQFIPMVMVIAVAAAVASIGMAITSWQVGNTVLPISDIMMSLAPAIILTVFGIAILYAVSKTLGK